MDPRLAPLRADEWSDDVRDIFRRFLPDPDHPENVFATLAHHPALLRRWLVGISHVLTKSTLAPRLREIAIIRVGWLRRAPYELASHARVGRRVGLSEADLGRIADGSEVDGWDETERLVIRTADQLVVTARVDDDVWAELRNRMTNEEILDLVYTVGSYDGVCMALNTLRVPIDDDMVPFPVALPPR